MLKSIEFEPLRDLPVRITHSLGDMLLLDRTQTFDALARPAARTGRRVMAPRSTLAGPQNELAESFGYTLRGELESASVKGRGYSFFHDNIGNREGALGEGSMTIYATNRLNQYDSVSPRPGSTFRPEYDADGSQTLLRTSTGDWRVEYDANNRPVHFSREGTDVYCEYDAQGRQFARTIFRNGERISHHRYLYRGYLQIAALDLVDGRSILHTLLWDPTEEVATRPLAMVKGGEVYYYSHDFNKNVTELLDDQGEIRATYEYDPFGVVGIRDPEALGNPVQWSSEMHDEELGLVYYNYRHYNPLDGRWISRDLIQEKGGYNLYNFSNNNGVNKFDILGLSPFSLYFLKLTSEQQQELQKKNACSKQTDVGKIWLERGELLVRTRTKTEYSSKIGKSLITGVKDGVSSILEQILKKISKIKESIPLTTAIVLEFEITEGLIAAEILCCQCNKETNKIQWTNKKHFFKHSSDFPSTFKSTSEGLKIEFNSGISENLFFMAKSITESATQKCKEGWL